MHRKPETLALDSLSGELTIVVNALKDATEYSDHETVERAKLGLAAATKCAPAGRAVAPDGSMRFTFAAAGRKYPLTAWPSAPGSLRYGPGVSSNVRALRRHHERRMKARAARVMVARWTYRPADLTPEAVGQNAAVHCCPCSCWGCRHHKDVPPPRERAALSVLPADKSASCAAGG